MKNQKILFIVITMAVTLTLFQNCADLIDNSKHSSSSPSAITPSNGLSAAEYAARVSEAKIVLQQYCVSCHNTTNGVSTKIPDILDLKYLETAGYIFIGSPQTSPLYIMMVDKVEPRDGKEVSDYDLEAIRNWLMGPVSSDSILSEGGGDSGVTLTPATYANVDRLIIRANPGPNCIGCHGNSGAGSMATRADLLRNNRIVPNNPTASTIWQRVTRMQNQQGFMPQGRAPLTPAQLSLLTRWINAGAPP